MRRELKVGVLVTLSVALVAAVFVGRAFSTSEQQFTRLDSTASSEGISAGSAKAAERSVQASSEELSAHGKTPEPVQKPARPADPEDELEKLLDNLASGKGDIQPVERKPLPTPPAVNISLDTLAETAASRETPSEKEEPSGTFAVLDEEPEKEVPASPVVSKSGKQVEKQAETASSGESEDIDSSSLIDKWIAEMKAEEASSTAEESSEPEDITVSRSDAEEGATELDRLLGKVGEGPAASAVSVSRPASRHENLDGILGLDDSSARAEENAGMADTYVVKNGDSFWVVAKKVYGKGHLWKRIAAANPSVDPLNLPEGKKLHIPPRVEAHSAEEVLDGPPGSRTHVVKSGESLWDIAVMHYGKGWRWKLIAQANPRVNPRLLPTGTVLIIPDEEQALSEAVDTVSVEKQPLPEGYKEHVIQPSDKLWNISREYYGNGSLYRAILAANPDVNDAHSLPVGKTILIPPKPDME